MGIGIFSRIYMSTQQVEFYSDRSRDAQIYLEMKDGKLPLIGPIFEHPEGKYSYNLPPHYYYLTYPIYALSGFNPNSIALTAGIFSWLSIPMFGAFLYKLFRSKENKHIIMLATGIGMLWMSVFVKDIVNTNLGWNPSFIPFFLFAFILLIQKSYARTYSFWGGIGIWFALGLTTSILASLHSATLFTIPLIYLFYSFLLIIQESDEFVYFLYGIVSKSVILISFLPFIIFEYSNNFINSKAYLNAVLQTGSQGNSDFLTTVLKKFTNIFNNYVSVLQESYFHTEFDTFVLWVLLTISLLGIFTLLQKRNKIIGIYFFILLLYLLGVAGFDGNIKPRYQIIIWFLPLLSLLSLLHIQYNQKYINITKSIVIVFIISASIFLNMRELAHYHERLFGANRLLNTNDMHATVTKVPENSKICLEEKFFYYVEGFLYFAKSEKRRDIKFLKGYNKCKDSGFLLHIKNQKQDKSTTFKLQDNPFTENKNLDKFLSEESFTLYRI